MDRGVEERGGWKESVINECEYEKERPEGEG